MICTSPLQAGIKALDASQAFWETIRGSHAPLDRFVVAGASKRGWTTWMVGLLEKLGCIGVASRSYLFFITRLVQWAILVLLVLCQW